MVQIAKSFAYMDGESLPHLTRLTNENGYVIPGGSEIVFKFVGIADRPKTTIPVHVIVNDEKRASAEGRRVVVRIRNADNGPIDAPLLRTGEEPEGECLVKRDFCVNLIMEKL